MPVEIANESGEALDEARLVALAEFVLAELEVHPLAELSILVVDEPAMAELHLRWMGEAGPTDVMAFPQDDLHPGRGDDERGAEPALLGDVVLCLPVARAQARQAGHRPEDELSVLTTHGILHLLGYDHGNEAEEREMFGLQARLLSAWSSAPGAARG